MVVSILLVSSAHAQDPSVFKITVDKPMSAVYKNVYESLEDSRFYVVLEPNMGEIFSGFAERWGDEYNQNKLTALRSMVFCNAWYANQVSNKDPDMLGFCPLHITLVEKQGKTTILFSSPTAITGNSPAHGLFRTIETEVIDAIKKAMQE